MTPQAHVTETVTAEASILDRIAEETMRIGARYMPTLTVKQFTTREKLLRELKELLVEGVDYGVIPGTDKNKPTLLLPGAQKLCTFFGYVPHYEVRQIEEWTPDKYGEPLFYYDFTCVLLKDRQEVGEGRGSCNNWEVKYRYRIGKRVCPSCGVAALIEGKQWKPSDPKQWVCFDKKGGCKAKFDIADERITSQVVGRVANADFADVINTVQKMGQKRAYIAATLSATGASQYFTQDLEDVDLPHASGRDAEPPHSPAEPPAPDAPPASTATGQSAKPTKPKPDDVPAEVMDMWRRAGAERGKETGGWARIFEECRTTLWELVGEDGQKVMDEVIAPYSQYGGPLAKETFFKRTLLELHKRTQEITKQFRINDERELGRAADFIDDSDIPTVLGGTFDPSQHREPAEKP